MTEKVSLPPACMAMNPMRHYPHDVTIAADSFEYVKLGRGFGQKWIFGNPEALIDAAISGTFKPGKRWDYWSQPRDMRQAHQKEKLLLIQPGILGRDHSWVGPGD